MTDRDTRSTLPADADRRLANLRREVPTAIVQIDSVRADDTAIAIKATIGWPGGGRHTRIEAHDVDPNRSWAAQYAYVQALAITRALDGLGIADDQPQPASQPPQDAPRTRPQPASQPDQEPRASVPQPGNQQASPVQAQQPAATSQPSPGASAVQRADGDHLAEYSWTSFWQTARARNITREQVEAALGRPIQQATPRDAVEALEAAGLWG